MPAAQQRVNTDPEPFPGWALLAGRVNRRPPELPLLASVDVLVVGGGASGVAAATTSAELGHTTLLVEKYGFCGGAAVAGMSGTICGLYLAHDTPTVPQQVVFGFAQRFREGLERRGGLTAPQRYGKTFTVTHDPLVWRETADDLLTAAGVRVLFHTSLTGVVVEGNVVRGVVLDSNAGRGVVLASRVVDASGDAAVLARGGFRYRFGDTGQIQNPTMFFRLGQVDRDRFLDYWGDDTICPAKVSELIDTAAESGSYDLPRRKIWIFPSPRPGELLVNATRLTATDGRMLNVIDPADFTEAELNGRRQVRHYARFLADHIPGLAHSFVVDTGVEAGIRQTRTAYGVATLTAADVVAARKSPDTICRSPWPIELHAGSRPKLEWLLEDYYDVPFATLVPETAENLIMAGRSLSADHEALASARVTAQCFEYGHAAGVAVALSIDTDTAVRDLPVDKIQAVMRQRGSALG
ncbi:FAD-dependent oxidoreductase [uncultured Friedmanniella sp.]|uniref:FAD-dependent oxidoreductase n=1 Tax=uncultured Friedmanniella sp. TaxID=335381 RepID=UPI0035CA3003